MISTTELRRTFREKRLILKFLIYFIGLFINCAGTALITQNALGSNAMNTLFAAVSVKLDLQLGTVYTVFNSTMILVGFIFARRYMGIGSFLMILVQGPFLNFWMAFFAAHTPWLFVGWTRAFTAVLALLVICFGTGVSFSMQLGTAGFEACLYMLADTVKIEYKYLKTTSELVYFAIAFLLDGIFGIMTIVEWVAPFISSYIAEKFNRTLWTRWGINDERNNLSRNRRRIRAK